ncbi:hypothetical protein L9G16_17305 [Shewanella sp. A25]|nr:hypothetical protein [Shewanella shenzhenensis]
MSGLDSYYAMIAQPARAVFQPKRIVDQVSGTTSNGSDSHETPQSQLPPKLDGKVRERRKTQDASRNRRRRASDRKNAKKSNAALDVTDDNPQFSRPAKGQIIDIEV